MLENARITGFTISELINQQMGGGGVKLPPAPPPRLMLNCLIASVTEESDEGEFFSFLSKHAFKTKTPFSCLRKVNSCFAVNLNFLITGFTQHLKKYSHPEVFYRKVVIKHSTHGRLFR